MFGFPELFILLGLAAIAFALIRRGDRVGKLLGASVALCIVFLIVVGVSVSAYEHVTRIDSTRIDSKADLGLWRLGNAEQKQKPDPIDLGALRSSETPDVDDSSAESEQSTDAPKATDVKRTPRPDWITDGITRLPGKYSKVISVGPYMTIEECRMALHGELVKEFKHFTAAILGDAAALRLEAPGAELEQTVSKQWTETLELSVGPMQQHYALVEFDDAFRNTIERRWREALMEERFGYTGLGAGAVLLAVGACFGYLKADELTGGAYRRRLLAGVLAAVSMVVLAAGFVLNVAI